MININGPMHGMNRLISQLKSGFCQRNRGFPWQKVRHRVRQLILGSNLFGPFWWGQTGQLPKTGDSNFQQETGDPINHPSHPSYFLWKTHWISRKTPLWAGHVRLGVGEDAGRQCWLSWGEVMTFQCIYIYINVKFIGIRTQLTLESVSRGLFFEMQSSWRSQKQFTSAELHWLASSVSPWDSTDLYPTALRGMFSACHAVDERCGAAGRSRCGNQGLRLAKHTAGAVTVHMFRRRAPALSRAMQNLSSI